MFSSASFSSISFATVTPVFSDRGRPEFLVEDDVATLGTKSDLDRVGQLVDAAQDGLARLVTIHNLLCHDVRSLYCLSCPRGYFFFFLPLMAAGFFFVTPSMTASTSSSFMMKYSSPSSLIS